MSILAKIANRLIGKQNRPLTFETSAQYWDDRYILGGNSGAGSYGCLAEHKAEILNRFVETHGVRSVVEFGSGDGNQLEAARYPSYLGIDVSQRALEIGRTRFKGDASKRFLPAVPAGEKFDLALSLDVIYHLIEDGVFERYMADLFDSADDWVIIYASNMTDAEFGARYGDLGASHVRHRRFTDWVANRPQWALEEVIPNRYPYDRTDPDNSSFADFHVFRKIER